MGSDPADSESIGDTNNLVDVTVTLGTTAEYYGYGYTLTFSRDDHIVQSVSSEGIQQSSITLQMKKGESYDFELDRKDEEFFPCVIPDKSYSVSMTAEGLTGVALVVSDINNALDEHADDDYSMDTFFDNNSATGSVQLIEFDLIPDWNHDRTIDSADEALDEEGAPFCFWINDDADNGSEGDGYSDMPEQCDSGDANCQNEQVDGLSDQLDFFPVWLDLYEILKAVPPVEGTEYRLSQSEGSLNFVYTDLTRETAGGFLTVEANAYGASLTAKASNAETVAIDAYGVVLNTIFLDRIVADKSKGVLMFEGARHSDKPLVLEIRKDGESLGKVEVPLKLSSVEQMFYFINIRENNDDPPSRTDIENAPKSNGVNVFFLHGFNVSAEDSRVWNAEMFKRLYQSGSQARFVGMTWDGDLGILNELNYQNDVIEAFSVSSRFCDAVNSVSGTKVVMAHSLGNMVVSSAIQDHGLEVDAYFMLNAAVASEAYDPNAFNDSASGNSMVHPDWVNYNNKTWCAKWHELFLGTTDNRRKLTWKSRFPDVLDVVYNFYSKGDEVLEVTDNLKLWSGVDVPDWEWEFGRYAWQKQEVFKGRDALGGTCWAGWELHQIEIDPILESDDSYVFPSYVNAYSQDEANAATEDELRENPVFNHYPEDLLFNPDSDKKVSKLLARGIPALSSAAGWNEILRLHEKKNINMNDELRSNGWGRDDAVYKEAT